LILPRIWKKKSGQERKKCMSNADNNRVLTRMGARKLTPEELDGVSGGLIPTRLSVLVTGPSSHPDQSFDT
jgi:hypothetical protein